jgi:predicted transcriptional regulator with HTH domain
MPPTPAEFELSLRRAPRRRQVLVMLSSLSEATPRALAQACGIDPQRLRWILYGHPPKYSVELAFVPLGLVEERRTRSGRAYYAITDKGRRKARQITARSARKAAARLQPAGAGASAGVAAPVERRLP